MAFLKTPGGNEVGEQEIVPDGEYDLLCRAAEDLFDEKGQVILDIDILTDVVSNPQSIRNWITWPKDTHDDRQRKFIILTQRRICHLFGVTYDNGFDSEEFIGKTARCAVSQSTYKNRTNNVLVLPELPSEDEEQKTPKRRRA